MVTVLILAGMFVAAGRYLYTRASSWMVQALVGAWTLASTGWAVRPSGEYLLRSRTAVLTDQLRGRGCQYQDPRSAHPTLSPLAEFLVRHPDYYCPMWAADHLAGIRDLPAAERQEVQRAFDEALRRKPESFDTGDGIILYGEHLRRARASLAAK